MNRNYFSEKKNLIKRNEWFHTSLINVFCGIFSFLFKIIKQSLGQSTWKTIKTFV